MVYPPLTTFLMENGRSGHFRAFPGAFPVLLLNLFGAYPGFGVIPAPLWVVVFRAVRRAFAGLLRVQLGLGCFLFGWGKAVDLGCRRRISGFDSLLDFIGLKCGSIRK